MSFAVIVDFSSNFVCSSIYQNRRSPYGRYSKQPKTPQKNYPNEKKKKENNQNIQTTVTNQNWH